jgi:hypothetical protein
MGRQQPSLQVQRGKGEQQRSNVWILEKPRAPTTVGKKLLKPQTERSMFLHEAEEPVSSLPRALCWVLCQQCHLGFSSGRWLVLRV